MPASPEDSDAQGFLCESFWNESFDDVVRVYARALSQLVHDVLQQRSSEFWLSERDLGKSAELLKALRQGENTTISTLLKKWWISPQLRRFVICIMRRLANIQIKKELYTDPKQRLPWIGLYYDFGKPDILDTGKFFPVDELAFFGEIFKK